MGFELSLWANQPLPAFLIFPCYHDSFTFIQSRAQRRLQLSERHFDSWNLLVRVGCSCNCLHNTFPIFADFCSLSTISCMRSFRVISYNYITNTTMRLRKLFGTFTKISSCMCGTTYLLPIFRSILILQSTTATKAPP
jgi:hypothetical protein